MNRANKYKPEIIISIIYIVGICGIYSPFKPYFLWLTPLNLIITAFFVFYKQKNLSKKNVFILIFVGILTWTIELIGVKTGMIFGQYNYGKTLGIKIFDIPPIIGLNWVILIVSIGAFLSGFSIKNKIFFAVLGAFIMTFLDFFIETIAIKFDFWHWENLTPPIQNYIGWFIISTFLFYFLPRKIFDGTNNLAKCCLLLQFLFFIILNIIFVY